MSEGNKSTERRLSQWGGGVERGSGNREGMRERVWSMEGERTGIKRVDCRTREEKGKSNGLGGKQALNKSQIPFKNYVLPFY